MEMNQPVSSCCGAPFDEDGYCLMCGKDGLGDIEDIEDTEADNDYFIEPEIMIGTEL